MSLWEKRTFVSMFVLFFTSICYILLYNFLFIEYKEPNLYIISLKGGDPTAGSPTVTLLRLHPSR